MSGVVGERAPAWMIAATLTTALAAAAGALSEARPWFQPAPTTRPATPPPVAAARPSVVPIAPAPAQAAPAPTATAPVPPGQTAAASCPPAVEIPFDYGRMSPPSAAAGALAAIVAYARAHADARVIVDGHADPSGDELGNLVLSKRRAQALADLLVAQGVPAARIVPRAFGSYVPVIGKQRAVQRRGHVAVRDARCGEEPQP